MNLSYLEALILGIVEGATEYLPVSSTGHLLIAQYLMGIGDAPGEKEAADSLAICIQAGAILAVLILYHSRIRQMIRGLMGADEEGLRLGLQLIAAFVPAAVIGLLFHDAIKAALFGIQPVILALAVGGVIILLVGRFGRDARAGAPINMLSWRGAFIIGLFQCLAFWPGFSRSLATILGALYVGLALPAAVEFSFLLGLITLGAATVFEAINGGAALIEAFGILPPLVAFIAAFFSAAISVKWLVAYLNTHGLEIFGYYRIALAAGMWYLAY